MPGNCRFILLVMLLLFSGCATQAPNWRADAQQMLIQLERDGARGSFPDDYASVISTFDTAEKLLTAEQGIRAAEKQYQLACQKGLLLQTELVALRLRLLEEKKQDELKRMAEQAVQKQRQKQEEALKAEQAARESKLFADNGKNRAAQEERTSQTVKYSVRRGETLPQIAARTEIYNNADLWPLIYRANRDQIRDPYQLWPGQILKIPRGYSKEEAAEARKQAAVLGL